MASERHPATCPVCGVQTARPPFIYRTLPRCPTCGATYREVFPKSVTVCWLGLSYAAGAAAAFPWMLERPIWSFAVMMTVSCGSALAAGYCMWAFVPAGSLVEVPRRVCANCGYDLRASARRCPECGVTTPTSPECRSRDDTA